MPRTLVYSPLMKHSSYARFGRGKMVGKGYSPLLLDGGLGGGSSYSSVDDYIATTGRNPTAVKGSGLAKSFTDKLGGLMAIKPPLSSKKPKNINFTL